jgi:hypothetical protein
MQEPLGQNLLKLRTTRSPSPQREMKASVSSGQRFAAFIDLKIQAIATGRNTQQPNLHSKLVRFVLAINFDWTKLSKLWNSRLDPLAKRSPAIAITLKVSVRTRSMNHLNLISLLPSVSPSLDRLGGHPPSAHW